MDYFTSDLHFGHRNIINHANRPYTSVEQMDASLIEYWQNTVGRKDRIFLLGDLSFHPVLKTLKIFKQLPGLKHWIVGNHDKSHRNNEEFCKLFESIQDVKIASTNHRKLFMSHYAHRTWPYAHHGVWHLYGHSHGTLADDPNALSMDVGVDAHGMKFLTFDDIAAHMATKKFTPIDHHGARDVLEEV